MFGTETYLLFLLFALVGLLEMGFVVYRIFSRARSQKKLDRLEDHLEKGWEENQVSESFYRNHREIFDADS